MEMTMRLCEARREREDLQRELDGTNQKLERIRRKQAAIDAIVMAWETTEADLNLPDIVKVLVKDLRKHGCTAVEIYRGAARTKFTQCENIDVMKIGSFVYTLYY
jgi:hypothetical protein